MIRKLITPDGNKVHWLDGVPWESEVGSSFPNNIVHGPALKVAGKLIGPAIFIVFRLQVMLHRGDGWCWFGVGLDHHELKIESMPCCRTAQGGGVEWC